MHLHESAEGATLAEVAAELGVTPQRAAQIEANALRKCASWCQSHGLTLADLLPESRLTDNG
jgi:DNA-directed RNA polymerase sigma subunit (sigma70/sigma32)